MKENGKPDLVSRIKDKLDVKKSTALLAALGLAGVALIALSSLVDSPERPKPVQQDEDAYNSAYLSAMQSELERAISGVAGAGRAEVYLTLERGVRYVYATEAKSRGDETRKGEGDYTQRRESESSLVLVDGENGKQPVILEREEPSIMGAAVICEGASNPEVRQSVINLVSTLCGVGTNRVSVIQMKIYSE